MSSHLPVSGQGSFQDIATGAQVSAATLSDRPQKRKHQEDSENTPNAKRSRQAYCPVCYCKFATTGTRNKHIGIKKCKAVAKRRGLPIPTSFEESKNMDSRNDLQAFSEQFQAAGSAGSTALVAGPSDHRALATAFLPNGIMPPSVHSPGSDATGSHSTQQSPGAGSVLPLTHGHRLFLEQPSLPEQLQPSTIPMALQRSAFLPEQHSTSSSVYPLQLSRSTSLIRPQDAYRTGSLLRGSASFGAFDAESAAARSYEQSVEPALATQQPRPQGRTREDVAAWTSWYRQSWKDNLERVPKIQVPSPKAISGPSQIQDPPSPLALQSPNPAHETPPQPLQWIQCTGNNGAVMMPPFNPPRAQPNAIAGPSNRKKKKRRSRTPDFQFESIQLEQGGSSVGSSPMSEPRNEPFAFHQPPYAVQDTGAMGEGVLFQNESLAFEQLQYAAPQEHAAQDADAVSQNEWDTLYAHAQQLLSAASTEFVAQDTGALPQSDWDAFYAQFLFPETYTAPGVDAQGSETQIAPASSPARETTPAAEAKESAEARDETDEAPELEEQLPFEEELELLLASEAKKPSR
ncbi:hypothetical protein DFH07DRAFT_1034861 [Mycena maculata]|uniref:Uncharacterized protein n=1 Tax=Mycena maculata TaxID=230809 RepID=A0AAD7ITN9_9AGAR|nr:hypothetical protein DFH07DRAFT_1034861 [Mycena maculata]